MLDGRRGEFPGSAGWIARLPRSTVAREPLAWAFLSAAGAGFIVGGIVGLFLLTAAPLIFSGTEPRPSWLTYPVITSTAAAVAVGVVAFRARGLAALALYVGYELLLIVAAFPGRQRSCGFVHLPFPQSCDIPSVIADRWPIWLALAVGAVSCRWLLQVGVPGRNQLLRGAGVFAVVLTAATTAYGLLTIATLSFRQSYFLSTFTAVYVLGEFVAGMLAGLILRRAPLAASVLLAVLAISSLAFALPLAKSNGGPTTPLEMVFVEWSAVEASALGAAGILLVRLFARLREGVGTIF